MCHSPRRQEANGRWDFSARALLEQSTEVPVDEIISNAEDLKSTSHHRPDPFLRNTSEAEDALTLFLVTLPSTSNNCFFCL